MKTIETITGSDLTTLAAVAITARLVCLLRGRKPAPPPAERVVEQLESLVLAEVAEAALSPSPKEN